MSQLLEIALGIMTAVGGFVEVGELVFAAQAGSRFGFTLIWVFVIGTAAIVLFGEMSGRVAAVAKQPVFNLMRQRLGFALGLCTLIASVLVNTITCAAEIGGTSIVLKLLTGVPYSAAAVLSTLIFSAVVWFLPFKWIERSFGLLGLVMITFAVVTATLDPDWSDVAKGALPSSALGIAKADVPSYAFFVVAILSAVLYPYELYFYSSGGIEDRWTAKDLVVNRLTAVIGFTLGSALAVAVLINAAILFQPLLINPDIVGTVALQGAIPFGKTGLLLALLGMLFAIAGAVIETALSSAYSVGQFFGWQWGRYKPPREAPRFTIAWLATLAIALLIALSGVSPLDIVEWAVVLSIVVLPLTYLPLILIANDHKYMGKHVNGRVTNAFSWIFYVMLSIAAVAALPLYFITSGGKL
jgi:manganese transport protein